MNQQDWGSLKTYSVLVYLVAWLGSILEASAVELLRNSQLRSVVEDCRALEGQSLETSLSLAWQTFAAKADKIPFTSENADAINGMGKIIVDCKFSGGTNLSKSDMFALSLQYLDTLISYSDATIPQKFKSHARIWKALIIISNHDDIPQYTYQDAWDLLLQAHQDHATAASLLWGAELILKYQFNPHASSRLTALEEARKLLDAVAPCEGSERLRSHLKTQQQHAMSKPSVAHENRCEYKNTLGNQELYHQLRKELGRQENALQASIYAAKHGSQGRDEQEVESERDDHCHSSLFSSSSEEEEECENNNFYMDDEDESSSTSEDEILASSSALTPLPTVEIDSSMLSSSTPACATSKKAPPATHRCPFAGCKQVCSSDDNLRKHLRTHSEETPFICDFTGCGKRYAQSSNLARHKKTHQSGANRFFCSLEGCSKSFTRLENLQKHACTHAGEKNHVCDFPGCSKAFISQQALKAHKERMHTQDKRFRCDFPGCPQAFIYQRELKTHQSRHSKDKPCRCDFEGCEKAFANDSDLSTHKRTHSDDRPYSCDVKGCGQSFRQKGHLINHIATHTGQKHACTFPGCTKEYSRASDLKTHQEKHHQSN